MNAFTSNLELGRKFCPRPPGNKRGPAPPEEESDLLVSAKHKNPNSVSGYKPINSLQS